MDSFWNPSTVLLTCKTIKLMRKIAFLFVFAAIAFTAFAQEASSKQDRFMKINEPYVFMSFLGNNDRIAGMQLPDWSV